MKQKAKSIYLIILIFVAGCALKTVQYPNIKITDRYHSLKEKQLIEDFSEYWHARISGDMKKAFSYELPYQRYIDGWKVYRETVTPLRKDAFIELKKIEPISENVVIVYKVVRIKDRNLLQKEKWIYLDGRWYHKYHQNIMPDFSGKSEF